MPSTDAASTTRMTPTRAHILDAIRAFVAASFCDGRTEGLGPATGLVTSGIVDSAGVVHVVEFLEKRFAITIADEDVGLANFDTLAALTELVAAKVGLPPEGARVGRDPGEDAAPERSG